MSHVLTKAADIFRVSKYGMEIFVPQNVGDCGIVVAETETGHNQEFFHKNSDFHYYILDGGGSFVLDDEEVPVQKGDLLFIKKGTRIHYKGKMRILLVTNPPWTEEGEVETKHTVW